MNPSDLIDSARQRAGGGETPPRGRPRQTDLQRAVSDAYYALFHALAICCADTLVGTGYYRRQPEWRQIYRSLEHGYARRQCNERALANFPSAIQRFGSHFATTQLQRHLADYDPDTRLGRHEVLRLIDETERIINDFNAAPFHRRRAFAVHVLFRNRAG